MFKHISKISIPESETRGVRIRETNEARFSTNNINYKDNHKQNIIKKQATSTKKFSNNIPIAKKERVGGINDHITHPVFEVMKPPPAYFEDPQKFLEDMLTRFEFRILYYMKRFIKCKDIRVFHRTIMKAVGCERSTIIRAMKKFLRLGLMTWEHRGMYQANRYHLSPYLKVGAASFLLWLNSLTAVQQENYMMNNVMPGGHVEKSVSKGNDTLYNINSFKREYIYKNSERLTNVESLSPSKEGSMSTTITDISPARQKVLAKYRVKTTVGTKLWAFSDAIIQEVLDSWNLPTFTAFINQCKHLSTKNGVDPKWYRSYEVLRKYHLPETGSTEVNYELTSQQTPSSGTQISTERKEKENNGLPPGMRTSDPLREALAFFIANKDKLRDGPLK